MFTQFERIENEDEKKWNENKKHTRTDVEIEKKCKFWRIRGHFMLIIQLRLFRTNRTHLSLKWQSWDNYTYEKERWKKNTQTQKYTLNQFKQ